MAEKTIYGQAWISGDSLVQDQIYIVNGKSSENTVVVQDLNNIWDDLTTLEDTHKYKTNGKGYFYWEVIMTSLDNDNEEVTVNIECPRPDTTLGIFSNPEPDNSWTSSEIANNYAKYWVAKLKKIMDNAENEYAIQRKQVIFQGFKDNEYRDQSGNTTFTNNNDEEENYGQVYGNYTFINSDIGDITNLLSLF